MARDQNQASEDKASEKGASESGDYAKLAKRMAAWTTNSLLTLIVLIAGVGFGRQVLIWWAEDDTQSSAEAWPPIVADHLGDPGRLHYLEFGDQPFSARRQSMAGDQDQAALALRSTCRAVVSEAAFPTKAADSAETKFLAQLAEREPVEEEPGQWRLYELREGFPLVAGTRACPPAVGSSKGNILANFPHRVVVWGIAIPMGPKLWTLYSFQPGGASGEGFPRLPEFPLPPECRKTLSLRVAGGGGMIGFEGPEPTESWTRVYDLWFTERDWKTDSGWQRTDSTWYARYLAPPGQPIGSVDVRFGADANGQTRGLLILSLKNVNPKESEDR